MDPAACSARSRNPLAFENRDNEMSVVRRTFWKSLIAVLCGNAIYFSVERFLPPRAQHHLYQIDLGLAADFWICLVCYGLLRLIR